MICASNFGGEFYEPRRKNKVNSNVLFFKSKPDPDQNPDQKLMPTPDPYPDPKKNVFSDPQHCCML
jgi:hypothetical protein